MEYFKPIAESNTFIVLDRYTREWKVSETGAGYRPKPVWNGNSLMAISRTFTSSIKRTSPAIRCR